MMEVKTLVDTDQEEFEHAVAKTMTFDAFLSHCTMCGGAWTAMLLTGMKECFRKQWDNLEDDRNYSFMEVVIILRDQCGVIMPSEQC